MSDIDKIRQLVPQVTQANRQQREAVKGEYEAWCQALHEALSVAAPALSLLHGQIEIEDIWRTKGGASPPEQQGLRKRYAAPRGVRLVDAQARVPLDDPADGRGYLGQRGIFEGEALFLMEDSAPHHLVIGTYAGRWSDVPGEENHRTLALDGPPDWQPVMRAFDLEQIVGGMADLLERHARAAPKRLAHAEDALARAGRLRAAALLLKDAG